MNIDEHQAKAESIERSLACCTHEDYETIIEGCMLAATHRLNILMHRRGLPLEQDMMHAEFLSMAERRRVRVMLPGVIEAMDEVERARTMHVRGDMDGGPQAATRALACLGVLQDATR
ncbi:MAG: hypothetical protein ABI440_09580 [Casimicrobiaceae bacterium]